MAITSCALCRHADRAIIEAELAAGAKDSEIAEKWHLVKANVANHRLKHLSLSPATMAPDQRAAYQFHLSQIAISSKLARLAKLQAAADRIEALIDERAKAYSHVPGGGTGMLAVRQRLVNPKDPDSIVDDCLFDAPLVKEYREILRAAAGEMGEWDVTGQRSRDAEDAAGQPVTIIQRVQGDITQTIVSDSRGKLTDSGAVSPDPIGLIKALESRSKSHSIQSVPLSVASCEAQAVAGDGVIEADGDEGGE